MNALESKSIVDDVDRPSHQKRLKIYVLLTKQTNLTIPKGDILNEVCIYKTLSQFADVYYSNQLFCPNKKNYGIAIKSVSPPNRKYDLYYIRGNYEIWKKIKGLKLSISSPYIKEIFEKSDAVITLTKIWKYHLENMTDEIKSFYNNPNIVKPKKVICFPQAIEPIFRKMRGHKKTKLIRKAFNADFVIVYFGRLAMPSFPHALIKILPKIRKKYPKKKIKAFYAGNKVNVIAPLGEIKWLGQIPHNEIPFYLNAGDLFYCAYSNYQGRSFSGSRHTLEAMAVGLPIICANFDSRVEMLGEDYPLFLEKENQVKVSEKYCNQLYEKICYCIENPSFLNNLSAKMIERAGKYYSMKNISKKIRNSIDELILSSQPSSQQSQK
jgi:glycosyltransferase involved in cell wall biosynthesis